MIKFDTKNVGVAAILGASAMWALEPIFAKLAYADSSFIQTSAVRAVFASLTALFYLIITHKTKLKVPRKEFGALVYIALAGTVCADLLYFLALTRIPVINAVLVGHMQPIFIVLIGYFALPNEKLTKSDFLGIIIMLIAALLVTTKSPENLLQLRLGTSGDFLVLTATFAWASTAIVMKKYLTHIDSGVITFYRFAISAVIFAFYLISKSQFCIANVYQVLIGVIVGVGIILYYEGLKRIKAAQVSAIELTTPFFAVILAFVVLGETVTITQIAGICLIFPGVYYLGRKEEVYF